MYPHFVVAAARTVANVAVYLASRGRRLLLEGRWRRGVYANWSGDRRQRIEIARPTTEAEVVELVTRSSGVRVVGAGHSFNDGLTGAGVLVSLDRLSGIIETDRDAGRVTAWAGTRLRDLTPKLLEAGLAIRTLASHDAQSLAGILSTDVHGTGSGPAHFSDQVVSIRLVDGTGTVHDLEPGDELFRAAVGGIGAVGIITRVTIECVAAFGLRQRSSIETRDWAKEHLDRLLGEHDHVSFYAYPFTDLLHVHTWDTTTSARSRLGRLREALNEAKAAIAAATFGDAMAHLGLLPRTAGWAMRRQQGTDLVLHSHEAFSRSQYHLHQELEVAVPVERVWDDLEHVLDEYERLSQDRRLPFLLVEVRFSPRGHDRSLLGPGAERATAWLCLCCNQSGAVAPYFAVIERWITGTDARVHLGKWCESVGVADLERMHGARFDRFRAARAAADPDGRFENDFVRRVLGPASAG